MSNYYFYFKEIELENIDDLLDKLTEIAERNDVKFMGGGNGRIVMLDKEYGDYEIPNEIVDLMIKIITDKSSTDIMGYFIDIDNTEFSPQKLENIKMQLKSL